MLLQICIEQQSSAGGYLGGMQRKLTWLTINRLSHDYGQDVFDGKEGKVRNYIAMGILCVWDKEISAVLVFPCISLIRSIPC